MIILTAGHTGPNSGAQCAETHFDEGAENIWLRNRIAEILTNKYGLVVLIDQDTASLKLLVSELNQTSPPLTNLVAQKSSPPELGGVPEGGGGLLSVSSVLSVGDNHSEGVTSVKSVSSVRDKEISVKDKENAEASPASKSVESVERFSRSERANHSCELSVSSVESVGNINSAWHAKRNSVGSVDSVREKESSVRDKNNSVSNDDILIDIHFNAHSNPQARGAETIVSDDATTLELQFASRLAHVTADALDIPLRSIKSESETPHRRLGMLHLTPQSVILEVCFCTSPEDVEAYRKHREQLAEDLARAIYELL